MLNLYYIALDHNPATEVFHNGRHAYVLQASDADYLTWVSQGNNPITGLTEANILRAVAQHPAYATEVRAASFSNETLANLYSGQPFSAITLATGDLILLGGQSTASQNGVYRVASSGAPSRATDVVGSFYDVYPNEPYFSIAEGSFAGLILGLTNTSGATPALFGSFNMGVFRTLATQSYDSVSIVGGVISGTDVLTAGGRVYDQASSRGTSTQVYHGGTSPAWGAVALGTEVSGVLPQANGGLGVASAVAQLEFRVSVNFNVAGDNAIPITLPTGITRYRVGTVNLSGASADLSAATMGLFTASGGGGTAIVTAASAITVTTASENTNNNNMTFTINNAATTSYTAATLYARVAGTTVGTGTVTVIITLCS